MRLIEIKSWVTQAVALVMNTLSYIQVPLVRTLLLSKCLFVDGILLRLFLTIDTLHLVNRLLDLPRDRRVPEFVFLERPYFRLVIPGCCNHTLSSTKITNHFDSIRAAPDLNIR
jgi:hypothetical protein